MRHFENIDALAAAAGEDLGTSDWMTVDQQRIDLFADATDDHQWIHVDVERAERESPFGAPVAHGFLTLSMLPRLVGEAFTVDHITTRVNYGLESVRFVAPVVVGSRIRARVELVSVEPRGKGRYMVRSKTTIEIEGQDKPACISEGLGLFIP